MRLPDDVKIYLIVNCVGITHDVRYIVENNIMQIFRILSKDFYTCRALNLKLSRCILL